MDKAYDHNATEDGLYSAWEASGAMRADSSSQKDPFTIMLPPPNVTGQLHLGHAAMLAIEDIMIRYQKMQGKEVLWVPGTDHAAIATENVVLKHLGIASREEMSREDFMTACRKFAQEKHDTIVNQTKKMGAWLDWSREAYTFDEARNTAVNKIFKDLYEDGLIERGHRMIHWSVGAQSVLSDDELEWEDRSEPFYFIRCGEFVIGTVRSETKCSDSPVVVHPEGEYVRVKHQEETLLFAKNLWEDKERLAQELNLLEGNLELIEVLKGSDLVGQSFEYDTYAGKRKFFVLADSEVIDMDKGTGAMTISVCHSSDDYLLAQKHKEALKNYFFEKLDVHGKMTSQAGSCEGLSVEEARKKSAEIMRDMGLLVGENKSYIHRVPICYRSGCVVEPMISPQWFVMVEKEFKDKWTGEMTTLKKLTADAVREGDVDVIPERFEKTYFHWIDNLRDWCISRQIWWGHQIPVWYGEIDGEKKMAVGSAEELEVAGAKNIRQDEDTLDTWFSSALWPFSTLDNEKDFEKFYPTDVLETGWDILFFWVARMIMFGRYATGKYPFHTTYLHGLVTDEHGKKMSKSKGNGIDPLDVIAKFGADAVRLSLVIGTSPGNPIPLGEHKIGGYRNFVNKLWNAGRFVMMQEGDEAKDLSLADKWIASRFSSVAKKVSEHLEHYQISAAGDAIYHFVGDEFCDWYIEASKADPNPAFLKQLFGDILKLTHPLCPFITESLWKEVFGEEELLILEAYPETDFEDLEAEKMFGQLQELVTAIRKLRAEKNLNPKEKLNIFLEGIESCEALQALLRALAGIGEFADQKPEQAVELLVGKARVYVDIPFDEKAEHERIEKEKVALAKSIQALEGRLANKGYVDKAPAALVEQTKKELAEQREKLDNLSR